MRHARGQVFVANGWQRPDGLCESAWQTISPFVMTLAHGGTDLYDGWMKNPASAMISCNDGFRPVSFLILAVSKGKRYALLHPHHLYRRNDRHEDRSRHGCARAVRLPRHLRRISCDPFVAGTHRRAVAHAGHRLVERHSGAVAPSGGAHPRQLRALRRIRRPARHKYDVLHPLRR